MAVPVRLLNGNVGRPPVCCVVSGCYCQQQHLWYRCSDLALLTTTLESSRGSEVAKLGGTPKHDLLQHHALPSRGQWLGALMAAGREFLVTRGAPHCSLLHAALPGRVMVASWLRLKPHAALPERVTVAVHNWLLPLLAAGAAGHGELVGHFLLASQLAHPLAARVLVTVMHVKISVVRSSGSFAGEPHSRVLIAPVSLGSAAAAQPDLAAASPRVDSVPQGWSSHGPPPLTHHKVDLL